MRINWQGIENDSYWEFYSFIIYIIIMSIGPWPHGWR